MLRRVFLVTLSFLMSHPCSAAADTVLKLYRPFGEVINQVAPVVKAVLSGDCLAQSSLILREDAWRCEAGGRVYDPCFAAMAAKQVSVKCLQSPWSEEAVQINLSHPLDNKNHVALDMSQAFPWGIELLNGEYCIAVQPTQFYDSMPIRYHCATEHYLMGYIQRCSPVWSMLEKTPKGVVSRKFKKAWF